MNKQSPNDRAEVKQSAFLEYHHYQGGLRTEHIASTAERPGWAPSADWVGFRDEVPLTGDDLILEVVKFASGESVASWIGLYRHSPDQRYGDRQNHAGIGVWLLNQFPSNPELFVEGLERLLEILLSDSKQDLAAKGRVYLREYLNSYLSFYQQLPPPLGGLRVANSQVLSTEVITVFKKAGHWADDLENLIYRSFVLSPFDEHINRVIVLLTSNQPTGAGGGKSKVFASASFREDLLKISRFKI